MDKTEAPLLAQASCLGAGRVVVIAVQHHLGPPGGNSPDLHLRRGDRHHDHGPAAQLLGPQGNSLGMVAGAGGNHTPLQLGRTQAHHLVVGTPQLEAEDRLQVLPLKQYPVVQAG